MKTASGHGKDSAGELVLQVGRPSVPGWDVPGDTEREHVVTHRPKLPVTG